jgi:lipoprotein-anchoring transpeptidase ErfK/SrfK
MNNNQASGRDSLARRIERLALAAVIISAVAVANVNAQGSTRKQAKRAQPVAASQTVIEAEQLLSDLGYWTGPVDGRLDTASRHALVAFQKVEGRTATGRVTAEELEALRSARRPAPLEGGYAHIEVDLTRQVLFVIDGSGNVSKVLPISSGNGEEFTSEGWTRRAITPTGRFKVHRQVDGARKSPLGLLYYPNYFLSGIAIHGAPSVPSFPASHGCVRIPMFAAKPLLEMTTVGTVVIVHGDGLALARRKNSSATQAKSAAVQQR